MRISSLAVLLAIFAAFLSCSINEPNPNISPLCKMAAKGYEEVPDGAKYMEGYKELDELDPSCKSEEKQFFWVNDTNTINPPSVWDKPEDYDSCQGLAYEEATACFKSIKDGKYEYWEQWRNEHKKRDLPISCVAVEGVTMWGAWLTDDEVAELEETYGVYVYGELEYTYEDGGGAILPPTMAIAEEKCGE